MTKQTVSIITNILLCLAVGFTGMYAAMRAQEHDWLMLWLDLSAAALFLRGLLSG